MSYPISFHHWNPWKFISYAGQLKCFSATSRRKGFNLENTHLSQKEKITKLIAVLALAFLFTLGWGVIMKEKMQLTAGQKRKSTFRLSLDSLNTMYANPERYKEKLQEFTQWVSLEIEPSLFVV